MNLEKSIEAVLFYKAEPVAIAALAKMLSANEEDIRNALSILDERLKEGGLRLIVKNDEALLMTAPEMSDLIDSISKEEFEKDLSRAALETLTIVLYKGPIARSQIDHIRGVNSQFILRSLSIRGLIERITDESNRRMSLYRPTFDLLGHLGIASVNELPEYEKITEKLNSFQNEEQQ